MNERIRELAEQALFESDFDDEQNIKITMDIFAELIVRECVTICNDTNDASYLNGVIAGRKIKQHFGVEE